MSAWLLVFVPVALFFIVSGFGFVGCILQTGGLGGDKPTPFTKYSDTDVIGNPSCVAYWPLSEPSATADNPVASAKATDVIGGNNGNYTHKGNAPAGMFPCPGFQLAPGVDSAAAIGFLALGLESLLPGDAVQPGNDPNILTTGMQVNGGFVTVPVNGAINPPGPFTIEAWARPEWAAADPAAFRSLIDSRDNNIMGVHGFAIWVNEQGNWEAVLNCTNSTNALVTAGPATLSSATHVVLTFDGANAASLFINGALASAVTPLPAGETFSPNTTKPLVIGVGAPWLPDRQQPTDNNFFPLFPFNGTIQDVAIYNTVLSDADILQHFNDGSGKTTVPAG